MTDKNKAPCMPVPAAFKKCPACFFLLVMSVVYVPYVCLILWQLWPPLLACATGEDRNGIFEHVNRTLPANNTTELSCAAQQQRGPEITAISLFQGFGRELDKWSFIWAAVASVVMGIYSFFFFRAVFDDKLCSPADCKDCGCLVLGMNFDFSSECADCGSAFCECFQALLFSFFMLVLVFVPWLIVGLVFAMVVLLYPILAKLKRFDMQNAIAICLSLPSGEVPLSWFVLPPYLLLIALGAKKAIIFEPLAIWSVLDLMLLGILPLYTNIMTVVSLVGVSKVLLFSWGAVAVAAAGTLLLAARLAAMKRGDPGSPDEKKLVYRYARLTLLKLSLHDLPQALLTLAGLFLSFMPGVNQYMMYGLATNTLSCVKLIRQLLKSKDDDGKRLVEVGLKMPLAREDFGNNLRPDQTDPVGLRFERAKAPENTLLSAIEHMAATRKDKQPGFGEHGVPLLDKDEDQEVPVIIEEGGPSHFLTACWPWGSCQPAAFPHCPPRMDDWFGSRANQPASHDPDFFVD